MFTNSCLCVKLEKRKKEEVLINLDEYYMKLALEEAKKAFDQNEVPVGCVIVCNEEVIVSCYNRKTIDNMAIAHAEVLAIMEACKKLGTWYLDECTLYTTIEPCMMCTGAIIQSRIKRVVYGSRNEAFGCLSKLDTKIEIGSGILELECQQIMSDFFQKIRHNNEEQKKGDI